MGRQPDQAVLDFADEVGDAEAGPVVIEGARTRWDVGGNPDPDARLVTAPTGIVAYTPEEMTITVRAGTPVAELGEAIRQSGQRCALPDRGGTVGGALAVGEDPLNVVGKGRVRACVLQVRYVSAEGKVVTSGGPTVKNVTGFDLPRLMVGSLGTLGCLAEIIVRTNPIPAVSRWLHADDADAYAVRDALYRPAVVLRRDREVWVLLEGHQVDVDAEFAVLAGHGSFSDAPPPPLPRHRWSMTPTATRNLDLDATGSTIVSVMTGTVYAANPQPPRPPTAEVATLTHRIKNLFDPTGRLNPGRSTLPGLVAVPA